MMVSGIANTSILYAKYFEFYNNILELSEQEMKNLLDKMAGKDERIHKLVKMVQVAKETYGLTSTIITDARDKMKKIKVLFLAANPDGTSPLQLDEEIRQITAKIRAAEYRDALEIIPRFAVRADDLLQALLELKPHIVHFSGHGSSAGELIVVDDSGKPKPISTTALTQLFKTLRDNIRVVLLNACYSSHQAEAIASTIDCTIGMNKAIGDSTVIVFSASFYRAVGFCRSVQEAFDIGKTALLLEGIPEEDTPTLVLRDGMSASAIALIQASSAETQQ
jgi:hypothetical protein